MTRCIPSPEQLAFMDWEFGVFFHFGIRSFFTGHRDWDNRPMPASAFMPEALDCGQWIRAAREAGATYSILVCKHHDGFANWQTKTSSYGVAQSPWKGGKGDVVREYVEACRAYGMKIGLYYSPAQWGGSTPFHNAAEYDEYFIRQISELLTNYGKIDYLWFDGNGSAGHQYDRERILRTIRSLQPGILIFEMWDPDTRWVGNEDGYAPMNNTNTCSVQAEDVSPLGAVRFLPAECDTMMRDTWFDCEPNEDRIKTTDELMGMYEMSVGRGANFLLNIGPNSHGLLPEPDVCRLREFGEEIRRRYGSPLAGFGEMVSMGENCWAIRAVERAEDAPGLLVNRLVVQEELAQGEAVREFRVYADLPCYRNKRICVYKGDTIGHKAICVFPTMRTARLTVEVTAADGPVYLKDMRAYYVG